MFESSALLLFVIATLGLLIVPGPAVLYIVARGIDQGRLAGLVSVLGIQTGTLFHVTAAALGLSAVLVSSALAFNAVKLLGAAYLVGLGVRKLRGKDWAAPTTAVERQRLTRISMMRVYRQGVVVNVLNPKTALFFFAFLPQFVDPARGPAAAQIFTLGLIFVMLGLCSDGTYALLAGTVGGWLKGRGGFWRGQRLFAGGVYIALGVSTALAGAEQS